MKKRFTKETVLTVPDLGKEMRIEADILNYTIEGVLFIECEDRWWIIIAYLLKSLNEI